jgi:hypothetical protein
MGKLVERAWIGGMEPEGDEKKEGVLQCRRGGGRLLSPVSVSWGLGGGGARGRYFVTDYGEEISILVGGGGGGHCGCS